MVVFWLNGAVVAEGPEYALLGTGIPGPLSGANALIVIL